MFGGLVWTVISYMLGTISAEFLFIVKTAERRNGFGKRMTVSMLICLGYAATYIPCQNLLLSISGYKLTVAISVLLFLWWLGASFTTMFFIYYCFQVSACEGLFRCIFGVTTQHIAASILQNIICELIFPDIDKGNPILYGMAFVIVYGAVYFLVYQLFARKMQDISKVVIPNTVMTFVKYFIIFMIVVVISNISTYIYNRALSPNSFQGSAETFDSFIIPWFCISVMILLCVVILLSMYSGYDISSLEQEKKLLAQIQKERAMQYEFSKENINLINQKCHDIKKQIGALRMASEEERNELIEETEKAVQFFDAAIKTGNETLDTILTEKSIYCVNHDILFTCNVYVTNLDFIRVIDLYSMLENALENAIECVNRYKEKEKKIIHVSVVERGQMVHFFVENYFEGSMQIVNGYPVTCKQDKNYHGYGIRSICMIASKYHGDFRIIHENQVFSVQIMIPIPE